MQRLAIVIIGVVLACVLIGEAHGQGRSNQPQKACRGKKCEPPPPSVSTGWAIHHSVGVVLETDPQVLPAFVFPGSSGHVNKLTKSWGGTSGGTISATIRINVLSGAPIFRVFAPFVGCEADPAKARLYFERNNWTSSDPASQYWRWWANVTGFTVLRAGTVTLSAVLDPSIWSSVFGRFGTDNPEAEAWFWLSAAEGGRIGFTFGGGCHFGHGVYTTSGQARMTVTAFGP